MTSKQRRVDIHDESGRINRSLWFIVISLGILLAFGIDGASIIYTRFQVESEAIDAAATAAASDRPDAGYEAALRTIGDPDMKFTPDDYSYDSDTGEVTVTVSKVAGSMFFKHIDAMKNWVVVKVTKTTTADQ